MAPSRPEPESHPPSPAPAARGDWRQRAVLGVAILAFVGACSLWIYRATWVPTTSEKPEKELPVAQGKKEAPAKSEAIPPPRPLPPHAKDGPGKAPGGFLDAFAEKVLEPTESTGGPALKNDELEKRLDGLLNLQDKIIDLELQLPPTSTEKESAKEKQILAQLKQLSGQSNEQVASFEKELRQARGARPDDPVPQWLTGELLIVVRGEPNLIAPFFQRALKAGFDRARIWASLSRVQLETNHLEAAVQSALKALERSGQDRYVWNSLVRAAFAVEKFDLVLDKLPEAFPGAAKLPDWAKPIHAEAKELQAAWQAEQELRKIDQAKDALPRVRLVIEHRKFATENGKPTNKIVTTPGGEVILELFEDQAPNTVANFLELVEKKFYDGTKFFLAEPASLVAGGCPLTKNSDPADDGSGGPGYTIPDEFKVPGARKHFRSSLSMAHPGDPDSAGSQFLLTLVPLPRMNGLFTVFGRVIKGQEIVDQITLGRTNLEVGPFGRIIPGDLLVRAEVIRKRPHRYVVKKMMSE